MGVNKTMEVTANGRSVSIRESSRVADLLDHLGLDREKVVVEVNGGILSAEALDEAPLSPGDKIEILRFIGGGSGAEDGNLMDLLPFPVIKTDNEGGILELNSPAVILLGAESGDSLSERSPEIFRVLERGFRKGGGVSSLEVRLDSVEGRDEIVPIVHVTCAPMGPSEWIITVQDVTVLAGLGEDLAEVVLDAEIANRALDRRIEVFKGLAEMNRRIRGTDSPEQICVILGEIIRRIWRFSSIRILLKRMEGGLDSVFETVLPGRTLPDTRALGNISWKRLVSGKLPSSNNPVIALIRGTRRPHGMIVADGEDITPSDIEDLSRFADHAGLAIDNVRLTSSLIGSIRELSLLSQVRKLLQVSLEVEELLSRFTELVLSKMNFDFFEFIASTEFGRSLGLKTEPPPSLDGREGLIVTRVQDDDIFYGRIFAVPTGEEADYGLEDRLEALAESLAPALKNIRIYQDLKSHSIAVEFLNKELERTIEDLKRANEMKSRFVSTVSHELRTPLTGIRSYTETLLNEFDDIDADTGRRFLGVILDEGARLSRLIDDLLDLARIREGREPIRKTKFDLADTCRRVLDNLAPIAGEKQITLEADLPGDPLEITADQDQIIRVLTNILGNAIQYTGERGRVSLSLLCPDNDMVSFVVEDTGSGIPEEAIDQVFEEFTTAGTGDESYRRGTGLGLAISKAIVEAHGGRISVESRLNEGSTFTVILPVGGKET